MYDARYAEEQSAKINAALKTAKVVCDAVVLDAGCGTGLLFEHIANRAGWIVGLDFSRRTLQKAKARAKDCSNVDLILADADQAPFRDCLFDNVFAFTLLQNVPNPAKTLAELDRMAKNGAVVVVTGMKKAFSSTRFRGFLRITNLRMVAVESEGLQCHVATCIKSFIKNQEASN
jgi:ubiquinone/menaquinone biosynthesis C-methylase UbiE